MRPLGKRRVPLNIMCSRKWAMPVWLLGSSRVPTRYQMVLQTMGMVVFDHQGGEPVGELASVHWRHVELLAVGGKAAL